MTTTEQTPRDLGGRPEAARVVWNWKQPPAPVATGHGRAASILPTIIGGTIAGLLWWRGHTTVATVVASITGLMFLLAMVSPNGGYAAVRRALDRFGLWVGRTLAWVLLTPLFYLFFFPFGSLARRGRKDTMQRWIDPDAKSYWRERNDPPRDPEFYDRQF